MAVPAFLYLTFSVLYSVFAAENRPVPNISALLKPVLWKRLLNDKEVLVNAKLEDSREEPGYKKYSFYAAMKVGAELPLTRQILTNYLLYSQMIPYIDQAEYAKETQVLHLEGGIWKYRLKSFIHFEEKADRWVHFQIIRGHFAGLQGNIYFESLGEKGTAVYMAGEQLGNVWPPTFVIERGAEIVFGFTATRMRSYIEAQKNVKKGELHERNQRESIPQPRRRFERS